MSVVIDIDASVAAMQSRLHENRDRIGEANADDSVCMHKVPGRLTGISSKAIEPEMVSIGPYHRNLNSDEFLIVKKYKWWSLDRLLNSLGGADLRVLFEAAVQLKERARGCYDESIADMSDQDFVEMMVLDGCFIVELFRHGGSIEDVTNDPVLCKTGLISIITGDLLKLENQLPFFVLEDLFNLTGNSGEGPLKWLALRFFNVSFPSPNEEVVRTRSSEFTDVKHLLHLFHLNFSTDLQREPVATTFQVFMREARRGPRHLIRYLAIPVWRDLRRLLIRYVASRRVLILPLAMTPFISMMIFLPLAYDLGTLVVLYFKRAFHQGNRGPEYHPSSESIQCVSKLKPAGVEFKVQKTSNFLDIVYTRMESRLQIPTLTIDNLTISVFINSIALEQCNQDVPSCFTTYIAFMICLIKSSNDVGILSDYGIINSSFSHNDHEVAGLFKMLAEKVNFHKRGCYLFRQFGDMEVYYNSPWAYLHRTYFDRPWSFISFFTALIALILTIGQAVLAVLTFIHDRRHSHQTL